MTQSAHPLMTADEMLPLIQELERRRLDTERAAGPPIWGPLIEKPAYWQVQALARFWARPQSDAGGDSPIDYPQHMGDLLTGLHGAGRTFSYLTLGSEEGVGIYLNLASHHDESGLLCRSLGSIFPGIEIASQSSQGLGKRHNGLGIFEHTGLLTGIPTSKLTPNPEENRGVTQQIERLLRGMAGQRWGYLVHATAIPQATSLSLAYHGLSQISRVSALVNQQVSYQGAQGQIVNGTLLTPTISHDQTNYDAKYCLELLERNLERLQVGKAEGLWQVRVYFFAATAELRDQVGSILRSIFSGPDSIPDPVRIFVRENGSPTPNGDLQTLLNSRELATLCQLPQEEFPGYAIRDYARFDTDLPQPRPIHPVALGRILDGSRATGQHFAVERRDLTKHGLIAGVTGSGKTTTIFSILDQLHNQGKGIPFLVIEPAKTEYRNLLQAPGNFPNLRIYTLGDERNAPFRINPFEFAIADAQNRIHVQTHIDYLKAVFNAAFVLYAPMPYVLETCLHEVYEDKGWDLATGINRRLPVAQQGNESNWPVFPTLTDLYEKVDEVVARLGYDERIEMDVKAGLKARIGSLRLGGKGLMLDCAHSVPMRQLLKLPTVLEMAQIGNEDEKCFILGLLLTALYEYHIVEGRVHPNPGGGLVHLTVLEEAHRLLKNVSTEVDTEGSNPKGQAVETFTNMLSEIRSFGEGILIAEQIPTKLAPDAIKNTNLKIVHRLLAGDDREVLAGTMNMDEPQSRFLTTLRPGQTVIHAEGTDHPYLVQMEDFKAKISRQTSDAEIRQVMEPIIRHPIYEPTPGFSTYFSAGLVQQLAQKQIPISFIRNGALQMLEHPDFGSSFDRYLLGVVTRPEHAVTTFGWLKRMALSLWIESETMMPTILYAVLVAVHRHSMRHGKQYGWPYHRISNTYLPLTRALAHCAQHFPYTESDPAKIKQSFAALTAQVDADLRAFQNAYAKLTEASGPLSFCYRCQSQCRYRFEAAAVAGQYQQKIAFEDLLKANVDSQTLWKTLTDHCTDAAMKIVQTSRKDLPKDAVLCYAIHAAAEQELSPSTQQKIIDNVIHSL